MDFGTFIRYFFYIAILVMLVSFLIYAIRIKSKAWILFASFLLVPTVMLIFMSKIDEWRYLKSDALYDLENLDIGFAYDFNIVEKDFSGIPQNLHLVKLLIGEKDKARLIDEIKNAPNFSVYDGKAVLPEDKREFADAGVIENSEYPNFYSREIYREIDQYPVRMIAYLKENSDTLTFVKYQLR